MPRSGYFLVGFLNAMVIALIGSVYTVALKVTLGISAQHMTAALPAQKMVVIAISAAVACVLAFSLNRLFGRQSVMLVGLSCGAVAFLYFYIVKFWPDPSKMILVIFSSYSLFAFVTFVGLPILVGTLWHRKAGMSPGWNFGFDRGDMQG